MFSVFLSTLVFFSSNFNISVQYSIVLSNNHSPSNKVAKCIMAISFTYHPQ